MLHVESRVHQIRRLQVSRAIEDKQSLDDSGKTDPVLAIATLDHPELVNTHPQLPAEK